MAKKNEEEIISSARQEAQRLLTQTEKQIAEIKNPARDELKNEIADLIILATEKIF